MSEIVAAHDAISPEDGERARAEVGRAADWMTLEQAARKVHVEGKRRESLGEKEPGGKFYSKLQSEKGRAGGTCITPQQIESEMCWVTDT